MPVPSALPPEVRLYLEELENRVVNLEQPPEPSAMGRMASTDLTTGNALDFAFRSVYLTDLNQIAYSNGAHWYKLAVGTLIV